MAAVVLQFKVYRKLCSLETSEAGIVHALHQKKVVGYHSPLKRDVEQKRGPGAPEPRSLKLKKGVWSIPATNPRWSSPQESQGQLFVLNFLIINGWMVNQ